MKHWLFATTSKRPKPDVLPEPLPVEVFNGNDVHSMSNIDCAFQTKEVG